MEADYLLRRAQRADAAKLSSFLSSEKGLKRRPPEEITALMEADEIVFYVLESTSTGGLIASILIDGPRGTPPVYEVGGAYVQPAERGVGFASFLTKATIATLTVSLLQGDEPYEAPIIIAYFQRDRSEPQLKAEAVGFQLREVGLKVDPRTTPGLEDMPTDEDGMVSANLYELPPQAQCKIVRGLLTQPWQIKDGTGRRNTVGTSIMLLQQQSLQAAAHNCEQAGF